MKTPMGLCMSAGEYRLKKVELDEFKVFENENTKTGTIRYQLKGRSKKCGHDLSVYTNKEDAHAYLKHPNCTEKSIIKKKVTPKPKKAKK